MAGLFRLGRTVTLVLASLGAWLALAVPASADNCSPAAVNPSAATAGASSVSGSTPESGDPRSGALAFTGADIASSVFLGLGAVALGGALVAAARGRRRRGDGLAMAGAGLLAVRLFGVSPPTASVHSAACLPSAMLPESPLAVAMPVVAVLVLGTGAFLAIRSRRS